MRNSEFGIIFAPYVCNENPDISVGDGFPSHAVRRFLKKKTLFSKDLIYPLKTGFLYLQKIVCQKSQTQFGTENPFPAIIIMN